VQAFGARLLNRAEYSGAQLGFVRLFAGCSRAFRHLITIIRVCGGEVSRVAGGVCGVGLVGKSSKFSEFWWQRLGTSAGPCSSRVIRYSLFA
jgi:hypothetical protein